VRRLETLNTYCNLHYPGFDKSWDHCLTVSNPNASKLSDHEKANVEERCITVRHNTVAVQQIEELFVTFVP
jgi:hypothetical protein